MKRTDGVLIHSGVPDREDVTELRAHFEPGLVTLVHWRVFGAAEMKGATFTMTDATLDDLIDAAEKAWGPRL